MWPGTGFRSAVEFQVPKDIVFQNEKSGRIDKDGNKYMTVQGVTWWTNLDYPRRHQDIILFREYKGNEDKYPKYDNYDAINVDKVADIPADYKGTMGVPIAFIGQWNPEQFEIVGLLSSAGYDKNMIGIDLESGADARPIVNRRVKYSRILIKKK